jgi:outer membrane receptor protein involved in Fe transport
MHTPIRLLAAMLAAVFAWAPAARAQSVAPATPAAAAAQAAVALDKFEIKGDRFETRNVDQPRTENDITPYVVVDRELIDRSGAISMQDFITQLPQNTANAVSPSGIGNTNANVSVINSRGLGAADTLVLVNGRRLPSGSASSTASGQADLNTIPLSAVERIEFLPSSAGAIYGANATGGVVNIILRSDYRGFEVSATYGNRTSSGDAARVGFSLAGGLVFNQGRTQLMMSANFSHNNGMSNNEGGFYARMRTRVLERNPALFTGLAFPAVGSNLNIQRATGATTNLPVLNVPYASVPRTSNGILTTAQLIPQLDNNATEGWGQRGGGGQNWTRQEQDIRALMTELTHRFTKETEATLQVNLAENSAFVLDGEFLQTSVPAANPFNPFGTAALGAAGVPVLITTRLHDTANTPRNTKTQTWNVLSSLKGRLPGDWRWNGDVSYGHSSQSRRLDTVVASRVTAALAGTLPGFVGKFYNPFIGPESGLRNDPALVAEISRINVQAASTAMWSSALRVAGPIKFLPLVEPQLSGGIQWRTDSAFNGLNGDIVVGTTSPPTAVNTPDITRETYATYVGATVPLIDAKRAKPLIKRLEFTGSLRYERQTGEVAAAATAARRKGSYASTTTATGLRFEPITGLTFRASYGEGFTPPSVGSIGATFISETPLTITDPRRNQAYAVANVISGGNPNLTPETSRSFNYGVVFQPRFLKGFRISADFYRIKKQDRIVNLTTATLLANEALMPASRITRDAPTAADTAAGRPGVITFLDTTPINSTELLTEGMDLNASYKFALGENRFEVSAVGTFVDSYKTQLAIGQPSREDVGWPYRTANAPLKRRGNARVFWTRHALTAGVTWRYLDSYQITTSPAVDLVTGGRVASASEFDVQMSYNFPAANGRSGISRWLDRTTVTLGASNVFDRDVPFYFTGLASTGIAGLYYSPLSDPIQRFVYMSVKKSF